MRCSVNFAGGLEYRERKSQDECTEDKNSGDQELASGIRKCVWIDVIIRLYSEKLGGLRELQKFAKIQEIGKNKLPEATV